MIIEEILQTAQNEGASDVHITVGIPPKMRVNGSLITMNFPKMMAKDTLEIMLGIMTEKQRGRFEERGEYDMAFSLYGIGRYRVHMYKQRGNIALAVRIVSHEVPSPEALGIPDPLVKLCEKNSGLILAVGPSGCGKTTTMASLVGRINQYREAHIVTLEEPIEYVHQHKMSMINQREIGADSETYAAALRAVLREDSDVIFIGDLREPEAIDEAITAAETGHLVLATMHTLTVKDTISYILESFPQHRQQQIRRRLDGVLKAIVSQRLLSGANGRGRNAVFEVTYADDARS